MLLVDLLMGWVSVAMFLLFLFFMIVFYCVSRMLNYFFICFEIVFDQCCSGWRIGTAAVER